MNRTKATPYDFIQRNYRDPKGDDPIERWLPHPENARTICAALYANGMPQHELEDGMQEVFVRALRTLRKESARVPADLRAMKAFCADVARKYAISVLRMNTRRERLGHVGICEKDADEYTPLEYGAPVQRDPVDAGRQLEVLAQLFREGRMPERGVDILEGVASGCTYREIGEDLGITDRAVEGRMGTMHEKFRERMIRIGLLPAIQPLEAVVSTPEAVEVLRKAA